MLLNWKYFLQNPMKIYVFVPSVTSVILVVIQSPKRSQGTVCLCHVEVHLPQHIQKNRKGEAAVSCTEFFRGICRKGAVDVAISREKYKAKMCHEVKGIRQRSSELPLAQACQSFTGEIFEQCRCFQEHIDIKAQNLMGFIKKFVTLFLIKAFLKPHTTKHSATRGLQPLPSSLQTLMKMTLQTKKKEKRLLTCTGFWCLNVVLSE